MEKQLTSIILLLALFLGCKNPNEKIEKKNKTLNLESELSEISQKYPFLKNHLNNLKNDTLVYKKCRTCNLPGLDNENIIGYTDRVRPTGNYFRKDIKIGNFKFDTYFVYEKKVYKNNDKHKNIYQRIYFCYFDEEQKEKFNKFSRYYRNMINHSKQLLDIKYINSTAIISVQYAGY